MAVLRRVLPSIALALAATPALAPCIARTSVPRASAPAAPAASSTATPAPAPTEAGKSLPKFFPKFIRDNVRPGASFISVGYADAPFVRSEFHPAFTATTGTFEGWNTGETTLFKKLRIVATTDYRSYIYEHVQSDPRAACPNAGEPGCITVVGPPSGSTNVPQFNARENELEGVTGIELGARFYVGAGTIAKRNDYGYSTLHGFGYAAGRAPDPREFLSPYASFVFYPNVAGDVATPYGKQGIAYRGVHYRAGALLHIGASRYFIDGGILGTAFRVRVNAPSDVRDQSGYIGLGLRY